MFLVTTTNSCCLCDFHFKFNREVCYGSCDDDDDDGDDDDDDDDDDGGHMWG